MTTAPRRGALVLACVLALTLGVDAAPFRIFALRFGAATTDRVTVANSTTMQDIMPMSLLVVATPTTITANRAFYMKGSAAGNSRKYVRIDASNNIGVVVDQTSDTTYGSNSAPLRANVPNYVAVTIDITATPEVRIYHGFPWSPLTEVTYGTTTDGTGGVSTDSGTSAQLFNVFAVDNAFQGDGYVMQVVSGVLSVTDVRRWQQNPTLPVRGARGVWVLGANGRGVVYDLTGNTNHGTITGAVTTGGSIPVFSWRKAS